MDDDKLLRFTYKADELVDVFIVTITCPCIIMSPTVKRLYVLKLCPTSL